MNQLLETVRALAEEIGPRPPTSAAEAQAAAYVNARMRQAGLDVDVQTFRAVSTCSLPYGLLCLLSALTPLLYSFSRPAALALSLLALAGFVLESLSFPAVSSWLPRGKSQNVVGTRPAAREPRQHLVILAHLDSSRAALFFHPRLAGGFRRLFLVAVAAMASLPLWVGLGWGLGTPWLWYAQMLPAAYLGLGLLSILHREIFMRHVPGANDDASGVAVLVRLAEELDNLQHTDLWFVATGCEESGQHGVRSFLQHYPFPRANTFVLNLDSLGQGELSVVVQEGMLWKHRADSFLLSLASQADAADIGIDADPRTFHTINTDAQVALVRRFRTLTLMALEDGRLPHWHWTTDRLENVQPELLERAARLAVGIARRLDRQE